MTNDAKRSLAEDIRDGLLALPQVTSVFSPQPLVAKVMQAGSESLGIGEGPLPVLIDTSSNPTEVSVSLGIDIGAEAVATCELADAEVRRLLALAGIEEAKIVVTIVHVRSLEV